MNKKTRALAAAAIGATLMVGTGSTFAMWNGADVLGAADTTITTGALVLTVGDFVWTDASTDSTITGDDKTIDPEEFLMVPGDVLVGTVKVDVEALGDNIAYDLTVADGFVANMTNKNHNNGLDFGTPNRNNLTRLYPTWGFDAETGVFTVTLDWSKAIGQNTMTAQSGTNGRMNETISFRNDQVVLQQVRPTAN